MSQIVSKYLGLNPLEPTSMRLLMVYRMVKKYMGISFDVIMRVDNFIFLVDFVILYCELELRCPLYWGDHLWPIGEAMVDIKKLELKFRVNAIEAAFNI